MGETLTEDGRAEIETIAQHHDVPAEAVATLLAAIRRSGGRQAQFSHPALGGMGQWSRGGGIMIGDMFNHSLKAKVEQLCNELAQVVAEDRLSDAASSVSDQDWWPGALGRPSAVGNQNDEGYACFPEMRRLAIRDAGGIRLYDTGDHRISGVAQQQGGSRDLSFMSQYGTVRLSGFRRVDNHCQDERQPASKKREQDFPTLPQTQSDPTTQTVDGDVVGLIARLHELQRNGVLTAEEFAAKKTELLARL